MASKELRPHISGLGRRFTHTFGRWGMPKRRQRFSSVNCTQRTPALFPPGMPGIGEEIEGAMHQAAQPIRHLIRVSSSFIGERLGIVGAAR